eukprot:143268_1
MSGEFTNKIQQIDTTIAQYYATKGINDYFNSEGHGKFLEFIEDNGIDEEFFNDEINVSPEDSILIDFDEDFPFDGDQDNKPQFILNLIKNRIGINNEYENTVPSSAEISRSMQKVQNSDIYTLRKILNQQCSTIYGISGTLGTLLVVGRSIHIPYLVNLWSISSRDCIKQQLDLTVLDWTRKNEHMKSMDKHHVVPALQEFYHRLAPPIRKPRTLIKESLEEICIYTTAAVQFIHYLASTKHSFPFQVDSCFLFNEIETL